MHDDRPCVWAEHIGGSLQAFRACEYLPIGGSDHRRRVAIAPDALVERGQSVRAAQVDVALLWLKSRKRLDGMLSICGLRSRPPVALRSHGFASGSASARRCPQITRLSLTRV